jgi:thermostable 8-oxoguanine DNA glycosylase
MIDPANITNFNRSDSELEEFACFAVLVAGKTAKTVAPRLENFLSNSNHSALRYIGRLGPGKLNRILHEHGFGCYNQKADTLLELSMRVWQDELVLRTCSTIQLESIKGIGPKTSRFFILHSRANARLAALDTHILKGLRKHLPGYISVPTSTPTSSREYQRLENHFLHICDQRGRTPAELDLEWWRTYSGNLQREIV